MSLIYRIRNRIKYEIKRMPFLIFDFIVYNKNSLYAERFIRRHFPIFKKHEIGSDSPKISVAITYFNRDRMLYKALFNILFDKRVDEIVILDDGSKQSSLKKLVSFCRQLKSSKIVIYSRNHNMGMLYNKLDAVSLCKNDWVILLDSDNTITKHYINTIFSFYKEWKKEVIYLPKNGFPFFIYDFKIASEINLKYVSANYQKFFPMSNAGNFFFNKEHFTDVLKGIQEVDREIIAGTDTMLINYTWLRFGNLLRIINTYYIHRVHKGSTYKKEEEKTNYKHILLLNRMKDALCKNKMDYFTDILSYNNRILDRKKVEVKRIDV